MWILCCGMKRSGSTLQYQITAQLAENKLGAKRFAWVPEEEFVPESAGDGVHVYKCHKCVPQVSKLFDSPDTVGVYTFRDIREVCASWIRKNKSTFQRLWELDFIGECLQNYADFTSKPRMLLTRYEEMYHDIAHEVRRISQHLGLDVSETEVDQLHQQFSLESQRSRMREIAEGQHDAFQYGKQLIDSRELLHADHITQGEIESWRRFFKPHEIALIEHVTADWLTANKYEIAKPRLGLFERWRFNSLLPRYGIARIRK